MASLLITGGAGFIGSNFVRSWRETHRGDPVVVLDSLTYAGNLASLADIDDIRFVRGDIGDTALVERLLRESAVDTLVHFAAESHVDRSIQGPDAFVETNILGTYALLKAAKAVWLDSGSGRPHRFHHVSTDEVYGSLEAGDAAFREDTPYAPNSPYAASKAASDHLVRSFHKTYGLEVTTSNCSNNYGPFQFPEKLIPLFLINVLHDRPLPIYGDGQQRRDWLYVLDHCRAIGEVIERGTVGECYNVGGGAELPNLDVIEILCAVLDKAFADDEDLHRRFPEALSARRADCASLKTFVADRPGHDRRYAIDDARLRRELGYAPQYGFETNFARTIRWYLDNDAWWRAVMDGSYRNWIERNYAERAGESQLHAAKGMQ